MLTETLGWDAVPRNARRRRVKSLKRSSPPSSFRSKGATMRYRPSGAPGQLASEGEEGTSAPKRQATSRILRPCGHKGPIKEKVVAVPAGRVVASGPGWIEVSD
ncbi:hypothetical protein B0H16DRAFT_1466026 [Mycena metata]|uniref:Uncharacterized protein n=1 Tax=Mycena metata TaxID=1033252 RepID=A0AAD7MYG4_9AGAR|nr:hypothetical protein B0H16DRAFT_1466026 [Mycena metata]